MDAKLEDEYERLTRRPVPDETMPGTNNLGFHPSRYYRQADDDKDFMSLLTEARKRAQGD